jgi:uncharacterized caspase-like protein
MKRIGAALGLIFLGGVIGLAWLSSEAWLSSGAKAAGSERRLALVIGNGAYREAPLNRAVSDARLIAGALRKIDFEVLDYYDVNQKEMKRAIAAFGDAVTSAGKDSVAFIYYSGHGVQVKSENYLIPVDENIRSEKDMDIDAVRVGSVMSMLENVETRLNVVVLDACRNNPFRSARSLGRGGLAQITAPNGALGSLVAFSTAPNSVAKDDSPYASTLAQALGEPGLSLDKAFMKVRVAVKVATGDEQVPWEQTSLTGDFYPAGNGEGARKQAELKAADGSAEEQRQSRGLARGEASTGVSPEVVARLEAENKQRKAEIAHLEEENRRLAERGAAEKSGEAAAPAAPATRGARPATTAPHGTAAPPYYGRASRDSRAAVKAQRRAQRRLAKKMRHDQRAYWRRRYKAKGSMGAGPARAP